MVACPYMCIPCSTQVSASCSLLTVRLTNSVKRLDAISFSSSKKPRLHSYYSGSHVRLPFCPSIRSCFPNVFQAFCALRMYAISAGDYKTATLVFALITVDACLSVVRRRPTRKVRTTNQVAVCERCVCLRSSQLASPRMRQDRPNRFARPQVESVSNSRRKPSSPCISVPVHRGAALSFLHFDRSADEIQISLERPARRSPS